MADPVTVLYDATAKLNTALAAGTITAESASFSHLISSASSTSDAVRQLSADHIPTFFHLFPSHSDSALSAYFDLLEDVNPTVRLHAIRGLPTLSKHNPALIPRLADVLSQLLITEDAHELQAVRTALSSLFSLQHRACFAVLVAQIKDAAEDRVREKATAYLIEQMLKHWKAMSASTVSAEEQAEYAAGIKTVLGSVDGLTAQDARFLLSHLLQLKVVKEDANLKQDLAAIIAVQARIDREFQPSNVQAVDAFIAGLRAVGDYKKYNLDPTAFLNYFQTRMLPVLDNIAEEKRVALIRTVFNHSTTIDPKVARSLLEAVWDAAKPYLPVSKPAVEAKADDGSHALFTLVESMLALIHQLASLSPDGAHDILGLFVSTGQPSDFRVEASKTDTTHRISTMMAMAQQWGSVLPAALTEEKKKVKEEKDDEARKMERKRIASLTADQRVATSVGALCKPLLAKTPLFVTGAAVSWRKGKDGGGGRKENGKPADEKGKAGKKRDATAGGKQQQQGASAKNQKTGGAETVIAGKEGGGKKQKGGGGGQSASAKASTASSGAAGQGSGEGGGSQKRKRGGDQQGEATTAAVSSGSGSGTGQQSGRSKKRKSDASSQQQQPAQQQQQQQGSKKRKTGGGGPAAGGAKQPADLSAQQMAAASVYYNQMMAQAMIAAQMQQQAAVGMQLQQQQAQGRAGGGGQKGGKGKGGQQQQQQARSASQKGGGGGGGKGGGGGSRKRRRGRT